MDHNLNFDKIYNIRNILHVSAYKAINRCPFKNTGGRNQVFTLHIQFLFSRFLLKEMPDHGFISRNMQRVCFRQ